MVSCNRIEAWLRTRVCHVNDLAHEEISTSTLHNARLFFIYIYTCFNVFLAWLSYSEYWDICDVMSMGRDFVYYLGNTSLNG